MCISHTANEHLPFFCILRYIIPWNSLLCSHVFDVWPMCLHTAEETALKHQKLIASLDTRPGKRLHSYGTSPFLMGKSTISMAIFKFANCWITRGSRSPRQQHVAEEPHAGRTLKKRLNASLFARGDPHNTFKIVPKCRGDWFRYGLRAQRSRIGGRMGVFATKGKPCRWQYGGEKAFLAMSYMALWDVNLWITVFHWQLRGYLGWSMYRNVWKKHQGFLKFWVDHDWAVR